MSKKIIGEGEGEEEEKEKEEKSMIHKQMQCSILLYVDVDWKVYKLLIC